MSGPNTNKTNRELQLAHDFVQHTGSNIFLTGKAGTGKTTFLHELQKSTTKRMIVTAPTGVAAINAGGVTLHSFFQLPFGPFVPGSEAYERNSQRKFRFSKEKKNIITSLDLLVIDEISMVRADLLDAVDATLRRHRQSEHPFGGVQLLMIGDLHQLSPVAKQEDWQLLQHHYDSVYFFSSQALSQTEFLTIELQHIYRQSDERFIELLNKVRDSRLDEAACTDLNQRYLPDFHAGEDQGYITLTTHNRNAEALNQTKLHSLPQKERSFSADVSGDFPENIFPAPATLLLKKGAQVMFVRNDSSYEKLYYNGKIGTITGITSSTINVRCPGDQQEILVEPAEWQNIKYKVNEQTKEIEEDVVGIFVQFPLKLAWAITIHKSQGLTFEKAIIDAKAAFAHGQVYVALSRCKSIEGMVLSSPILSHGVGADTKVLDFDEKARHDVPSEGKLRDAQIFYQQRLLYDCFDLGLLRNRLSSLSRILQRNARFIQVFGVGDIDSLQKKAAQEIFAVGDNFKRQLGSIFVDKSLPESDPHILERISKASRWFQEKFTVVLDDLLKKLHVDTDNVVLGKKIGKAANNLKREITVKLAGICSCEKGFSPSGYLRAVSAAELDFQSGKLAKSQAAPSYTKADIVHPELFQTLREWRSKKAQEEHIGHSQILQQRVLIQVVVCLPESFADLAQISGVGKKTIMKYGQDIVAIVVAYRKKEGITRVELPEAKPVSAAHTVESQGPSSDTKDISLALFQSGMTVAQIAHKRSLVSSTIETHLCFFVENGRLDLCEIMSAKQQKEVADTLAKQPTNSLGEVKKALNDQYSYGQIKMVLAQQKFLAAG